MKEKNIEIRYSEKNFPVINPEVFQTKEGTLYLKESGVAVVSVPSVDISGLDGFFSGFPKELGFDEYLKDPNVLKDPEQLAKMAGQLCYLSFGPDRTANEKADIYFDNIFSSGHGSVLEHSNISLMLWGVSRSLTHELVRHRAGFGFSQVSQRYVSGKKLRFVERPEYAANEELHHFFEDRIDRTKREYEELTSYLLTMQKEGVDFLQSDKKTDRLKKVRQTARSILPNETEAPIVVTGNVRSWRHFLSARGSSHAEIEIRKTAVNIYSCLTQVSPLLFGDIQVEKLPDGTLGLISEHPKV